ncbi:hypothetical protein [Streptomyces zagrosensis]|uniref:Uncharacterized protein n=1 Tax=Streptomyces zagrosensis TaxID=1042984 RepID=A0A7W9V2C3_9ACTN|nr:hypothetical protein [Streptomyces zagrosensis]MBB5940140.1 hypothetical protein [Streptomyces zagrosensis]
MNEPDHWPPAPEPADKKVAQLLAARDQLAADVHVVDDANATPAACRCARCRALDGTRDRARALREWPPHREAVDVPLEHRRVERHGEESGRAARGVGKRSLVLTGQHTVRTVQGTVLRFFLADAAPSDLAIGWKPVADIEFQHAYENALFDPRGLESGELRANTHRIQLALDAIAGPGGFFWSDGARTAGVMTTNGMTPEECGLDYLADMPKDMGDVS